MPKVKATEEQEKALRKHYQEVLEAFRKNPTPENFKKTARIRGVLSAVTRSRKYGTLVDSSLIERALKDC